MVTPTKYVAAPPVEPLPYTLLSAAVVVNDPDPHAAFGVEWEPEFCGPARLTVAACLAAPEVGTAEVNVDDARHATIIATDAPTDQTYSVDWGDDTAAGGGSATTYNGAGFAHTYAAAGDYTVTVTGSNGYHLDLLVHVNNAAVSGPFEADAETLKVADDGVDLVTSTPFVVYHLMTCRLVGRDDLAERSARALELGEPRAVEQAFADLLTANALDPDVAVTDLTPTPGTAVDPVTGLGILEQFAGQVYGGRPTFHSTRDIASNLLARNALVATGDMLRTNLGSKYAAGSGYAGVEPIDGQTPGVGEGWLIVTGTVMLRRSDKISTGEVPTLAQPTNEVSVLGERPESIGYECFAAAVLVSTEAVA